MAKLSLGELLDAARALTEEMAARVADPTLPDAIERFPEASDVDRSDQWGVSVLADASVEADVGVGEPAVAEGEAPDEVEPGETRPEGSVTEGSVPGASVPDGSLPVLLLHVEELARQVDVARTALAGHVDQVFDAPVQRREVLGIPEGKSAHRNAAEYLCHQLRIRRTEARRRIGRAGLIMERRSLDGTQVLPPEMPALSGVVHGGQTDMASVDVVADTLVAARKGATLAGANPRLVDQLISDGERVLAAQVKDADPDTVKKACIYWRQRFDALANPDGTEPTEAQAQAAQGLFYRGRGPANLHEWSLLAGDSQHEILKTIAAAASSHRRNRVAPPAAILAPEGRNGPASGESGAAGATEPGAGDGAESAEERTQLADEVSVADHTAGPDGWSQAAESADALDARSRAQRELDGLISALSGALSLTAHGDGGTRPQVLVTIDYQTLAGQLEEAGATGTLISQAAYAGPVSPRTIRQMACDADMIPVVLGGEGEVLDVGRAHRLFPRRLRRAITARDGGCAAPACSIPAPWCEAHHIEHWENGGPTSVDNGVLLCSHHHHAVHAESWEISVRDGIPWFIPARHLDPEQRPRRNRYWRPGALDDAA